MKNVVLQLVAIILTWCIVSFLYFSSFNKRQGSKFENPYNTEIDYNSFIKESENFSSKNTSYHDYSLSNTVPILSFCSRIIKLYFSGSLIVYKRLSKFYILFKQIKIDC
ncbi:MAG: hypothetical protein D8M18_10395 [Bacteroidetes bacterium]|nr:hypothetical protein [Bacteroidota bacterium]